MLLHFTGLELSKLLKRFFITSFCLEYLAEAGLHGVSCLRAALDDIHAEHSSHTSQYSSVLWNFTRRRAYRMSPEIALDDGPPLVYLEVNPKTRHYSKEIEKNNSLK